MENQLKQHDFITGDSVTIADIALFACTHVADEGDFDLDDYPAITDWIRQIRSRPNYVPM